MTVPTHSEIAEAWKEDGGVETLWHKTGQDSLCIIAPHGGDIEAETDTAAVEMYKKMKDGNASLWMFQGFDSSPVGENAAFDQYHVTSADIDSELFPRLSVIEDVGFEYCVSFHVNGSSDKFEIGGLANNNLRRKIGEKLTSATLGTVDHIIDRKEGEYMAVTEQNITNRLTESGQAGIQIEMPGHAAKTHRKTIAQYLANLFNDIVG
jgi:phage replication-related protein YjqB (UPF0714/DUF867 family)